MDFDGLPDNVPIVRFTPTACGLTTLTVETIGCDGFCEWIVQVLIEDPTPK